MNFSGIFKFCFFLAISIQLVNFAGVFPESWNSPLGGITDLYQKISATLNSLQGASGQNLLTALGSYGYLMFLLLQLVLMVTLFAPIYVGSVLSAIFSGVGLPSEIGYIFTIIAYFGFVMWIVDVLRGREVGAS